MNRFEEALQVLQEYLDESEHEEGLELATIDDFKLYCQESIKAEDQNLITDEQQYNNAEYNFLRDISKQIVNFPFSAKVRSNRGRTGNEEFHHRFAVQVCRDLKGFVMEDIDESMEGPLYDK